MKQLFTLLFLLTSLLHAAPIQPNSVVVLYNSSIPESKELAQHYAKARSIPQANLVGLDISTKTV